MNVSEVRDHLDQACEFPVDHASLVAQVGQVDLDAPTDGAETVGTVLERSGETRYRTARDAHQTILTCVGEAYIGRKHYDDRSGARLAPAERSDVSV